MFEDMFDMDTVTLDVEGDPVKMALAWASAAHCVAGPYWPAAFGIIVATAKPSDNPIEWLREVGHETDRLVDELADAEIKRGGMSPRYPAWYESQAGGLFLVWDTSVSIILGPGKNPAHLRLVLLGAHEVRERFIREALANKEAAQTSVRENWSLVVEPFLRF